jgi:hypothetical protein
MEQPLHYYDSSLHPLEPQHNPFPSLVPQLIILTQRAHAEEQISKNGVPKNVLIIVKNSPFHMTLGATDSSPKVDFNQVAFEASLLYDCESEKEVDFVKAKPLEFKSTPSENGLELEVEIRVKVLTSQHEDMLFKVKIQGYNPITRQPTPGLSLITAPIKVISKPEQLKKNKTPSSKKRTVTDMLLETINRIEKKQEEQQKLIEKMLSQQSNLPQAPIISTNNGDKRPRIDNALAFWEEITNPEAQVKEEKKDLPVCFEEAFIDLVKAYNNMKSEEKPETIRRLIRNSSSRDTERLSELLDLFWTDGLHNEPSLRSNNFNGRARDRFPSNNDEGCTCSDCPHKVELERLDEFYKEFLSSNQTMQPHY